jgi:hypothetical protein
MKKAGNDQLKFRMRNFYFISAIWVISGFSAMAQDVYMVSGGEVIFQSAGVERYGNDINTNLRFTVFFHAGEYLHLDAGDHFGLFSGIGIRNVGFITEENDVRIKYRTYNLGIPLAIKLGSFSKNLYMFAGAEYEWMIHYKQKVFENGNKTKYSSWFSNRTPDFIPSAFVGFQFPAGIQFKFRYYLNNYLNEGYNDGGPYSNFTGFNKTQVWYISVSFMIRNHKIRELKAIPAEMAAW